MTAPKRKRLVVRVLPDGGAWQVTLQGVPGLIDSYSRRTQVASVRVARRLCRDLNDGGFLHLGVRFLVELHVHSRKGRVRIRETYGADPRRSRG